ncbi:hypothetical protein DND47_31115 [Pseudomonas syringae pv. syringae]|nr:hypothetical protein DND47_31115 [Pseudomonas syringae pv. syringae]
MTLMWRSFQKTAIESNRKKVKVLISNSSLKVPLVTTANNHKLQSFWIYVVVTNFVKVVVYKFWQMNGVTC